MEGKEGVADEAHMDVEVGGADEEAMDTEDSAKVDEEEVGELLASLSALETDVNEYAVFYNFEDVDTQIYVCALCKRRLLLFTEKVHVHEVHTIHVKGGEEED